jgi:hypothetical protein
MLSISWLFDEAVSVEILQCRIIARFRNVEQSVE